MKTLCRGTCAVTAVASSQEAGDFNRRAFIATCGAAAVLGTAKASTAAEELAAVVDNSDTSTSGRPPDTTITHKVYPGGG